MCTFFAVIGCCKSKTDYTKSEKQQKRGFAHLEKAAEKVLQIAHDKHPLTLTKQIVIIFSKHQFILINCLIFFHDL